MFPSPATGEMYHPDSVKILKDASLEHIPLYSLRHTFATVALQNGIDVKQYAGPLRRRLHSPHLHSRHPSGPESSRRNHGKFHGPGHVAKQKKKISTKRGERFLSRPLPSVVVHPIVGHGVGQQKTAKINQPQKLSKQEKSPKNQPVSERFWSC